MIFISPLLDLARTSELLNSIAFWITCIFSGLKPLFYKFVFCGIIIENRGIIQIIVNQLFKEELVVWKLFIPDSSDTCYVFVKQFADA